MKSDSHTPHDPWEGQPYDAYRTPPLAAAPRTIPLTPEQRLTPPLPPLDPQMGQPAPRSIRRMQAPDLLADDGDNADEPFGDLGQFGISSAELPAMYPQAAWERTRWEAEQRARVKSAKKIDLLYKQRIISGPAFDLLQVEFERGYVPVVEWHGVSGWYRVWSAAECRWYSLDGWERHVQSQLAPGDPDRQTAILTRHAIPTPPPAPASPQRPWPPELDSGFRATPPPVMRRTAPHAPHSRPLPPAWLRTVRERKPWEG